MIPRVETLTGDPIVMTGTDSDCTSHSIRVVCKSSFVPEQSDPAQNRYFFSYTIRVSNEGSEPARLLNRHWKIRDAAGRAQEVRGPGVVGEQPRLDPGESFEYTSFCPLSTPTGSMRGTYEMQKDDGHSFQVTIGAFHLVAGPILN